MMFRPARLNGLPLTLLLASSLACADDSQTPAPKPEKDAGTQWSIGLGANARRAIVREADNSVSALPMVMAENRWIRLAGNTLDAKLFNASGLSVALRGTYALGDGYKADDSPVLDGMAERKGSFWVGPALSWRLQGLSLSADWLADASRYSKGTQASLGVSQRFMFAQRYSLEPRLQARWTSSRYTDYYYGVEANEARVDRPAYEGSSGVNFTAGLRGGVMFDRHNSIALDLALTRLNHGVRNSPLVDRSVQPQIGLFYLYRF